MNHSDKWKKIYRYYEWCVKIFFTITSTIWQCLVSPKFRAFAAHPLVPMLALSFQFVGSGLDAIDTSLHCAYFWKTKLGTFMYFSSTIWIKQISFKIYLKHMRTIILYLVNINHMISPQLEDPELRVCGYDMTMGVQKAFWTSGTSFRSRLFTWHRLMHDWSAKGKLKWIMWAVFGAIGSSLSTQPQPERSFKNSVEILTNTTTRKHECNGQVSQQRFPPIPPLLAPLGHSGVRVGGPGEHTPRLFLATMWM